MFESLGLREEVDRSRLFVLVDRARRAFSVGNVGVGPMTGVSSFNAGSIFQPQPPPYEMNPTAVPGYSASVFAAPPVAVPQQGNSLHQETGEPPAADRESAVKKNKHNGSAHSRSAARQANNKGASKLPQARNAVPQHAKTRVKGTSVPSKRKQRANDCVQGGKKAKKASTSKDSSGAWDCDTCGARVLATKSRCGKCHRWKGGKRKGGWKIKATEKPDDGTVPWHLPWTCCGVTFGPEKRRCGKCSRWRGGKRRRKDAVSRKASTGSSKPAALASDLQVPALPDYAMPATAPLYGYPNNDLALTGYQRQFDPEGGLALPEPIPGYSAEASSTLVPPPHVSDVGGSGTEGGAPEGQIKPHEPVQDAQADASTEEKGADVTEKSPVGV